MRWAPGFNEFVVHDVAQGSSAASAGLQPQDAIVAINNQPASAFTLEQVSAMLTEAGQSYRFRIRRKDGTREVTITLAARLWASQCGNSRAGVMKVTAKGTAGVEDQVERAVKKYCLA